MSEGRGRTVGLENSESGMTVAGVLEPPYAINAEESDASCKLMGIEAENYESQFFEEAVFPDTDDSEVETRKLRKSQMADSLKKLIKSEIIYLTAHLENELPQTVHILTFIKMLLKWKDTIEFKRQGIKYTILVNREECAMQYTVIIAYYILQGQIKGSVFAPTKRGRTILKEALRYSRYFPIPVGPCEWSIYPIQVAADFMHHVRRVNNNELYMNEPKCAAVPVKLYWIRREDVLNLQIDVPREVKVQSLDNKLVSTINYFWGRHHQESEKLIHQMVSNNLNIGAFTFNDEFVSWALQTHYGAVDVFFTIPKFRNRGIGRGMLLSLCLMLAENDYHSHAFVVKDNFMMEKFLTKLGFKLVDEMIYFSIDPLQTTPLFPDKTI